MLRRYIWEKAKEKLRHYRRRTQEASGLYQIVYHSRDDLQFQWQSRFQHQKERRALQRSEWPEVISG